MKKLDHLMTEFDHRIDRKFGRFFNIVQRHFTLISSVTLSCLLGVFVFKILQHRPYQASEVINADLQTLIKVFAAINNDCKIVQIKGDRLPVNFLTVKKFVGSAVGSLELAHPEKWRGPYFKANPTIAQRCYEIVQVDEGFFLVPGDGVRLPNGTTIGKDFKISKETSIRALIRPGGALFHQGHALAVELPCKVGVWNPQQPEAEKSGIEIFNGYLEEFNQALPFTKNEHGQTHTA